MLDRYIFGSVDRISPEAPVPVLLRKSEECYLGGAGNVFSNIISLGAKCDLLTVLGDDSSGSYIRSLVSEMGGNTDAILVDTQRKTTTKSRVIGNLHQLLRIDDEDSSDIDEITQGRLLARLREIINNYTGVIIQDYNKGILTPSIISGIVSLCRNSSIPVLVDPKRLNVEFYKGANIFKPNLSEFSNMIGKKNLLGSSDLYLEASKFREDMNLDLLVITLSDRGILYSSKNGTGISDGFKVNVSDVSGAGDSVSAILILSYLSGTSIENIMTLCNIVGSIACSRFGSVSVSFNDLIENQNLKYLK